MALTGVRGRLGQADPACPGEGELAHPPEDRAWLGQAGRGGTGMSPRTGSQSRKFQPPDHPIPVR